MDAVKKFQQAMSILLGHSFKELLHYTGGKDKYALSDRDLTVLGIAVSDVQAMVNQVAASKNVAQGSLAKRMHNELACIRRALEMRNHTWHSYRMHALANTEREIVKFPGKVQNIVKLFKQAQAEPVPANKNTDKSGVFEQVDEYAKAFGHFEA